MEPTNPIPGESTSLDSDFGKIAHVYRLRTRLAQIGAQTAQARINVDYWTAMVDACCDAENKVLAELNTAPTPFDNVPHVRYTETVSGDAAINLGRWPVEFESIDSTLCECERWRNGVTVCPVHRTVKPGMQSVGDAKRLNADGLCGTCGTEFTPANQPVNSGFYWTCGACDALIGVRSETP